LYTLYTILRKELEFIRNRMKRYYNKYRLEGPCLERGDKVYLISRNLRTKRLSGKLDFKKIRPFKINKRISISNYRLSLLVSIKLQTNIFYILLLELAPKSVKIAIDIEAEDKEEE
jgi:hypothetical protein